MKPEEIARLRESAGHLAAAAAHLSLLPTYVEDATMLSNKARELLSFANDMTREGSLRR